MSKAFVLLSGGADSTICAAIARNAHDEVHAVSIYYQQRHSIEIESARAVAEALKLDSHEIVDISYLAGKSPLTSDNPVEKYDSADALPDDIASTFVPNRNAVFLMIAANRAIAAECNLLYTGVSGTDYSGYPDCRREFIDSMEQAISLGNFGETGLFRIHTPLMWATKAESVRLGINAMGKRFDEVMALTHTCYEGIKGGCGKCAACLLRDRGFKEAGRTDPIWQFRKVAA